MFYGRIEKASLTSPCFNTDAYPVSLWNESGCTFHNRLLSAYYMPDSKAKENKTNRILALQIHLRTEVFRAYNQTQNKVNGGTQINWAGVGSAYLRKIRLHQQVDKPDILQMYTHSQAWLTKPENKSNCLCKILPSNKHQSWSLNYFKYQVQSWWISLYALESPFHQSYVISVT